MKSKRGWTICDVDIAGDGPKRGKFWYVGKADSVREISIHSRIQEILVAENLSESGSVVNPWTVAHQAPRSVEFPRQEYWSGLWFPSPWALPDPGIHPGSPNLAGGFFTIWATREGNWGFIAKYLAF